MDFKELGPTGVKVPEIGLGTWKYRGGVEPLRKGISVGSFLVDTAEMYSTEGVVGEAIKGQREQVFVATKVSGDHVRYKDVLTAAESSLKRLGTDYIDLYQVHWPNPRIPVEETMRAMETLVDTGKVRFIGVSNFSVKEIEEAQKSMSRHKIVSNQVLYSLSHREIEKDLLPYCQQNNITVIAYTPLAHGGLATKAFSQIPHRQAIGELQKVASETGKSMAQVALNWCISKLQVIAIPKSDRVERVEENCNASGWRLTAEQLEALDRAFR